MFNFLEIIKRCKEKGFETEIDYKNLKIILIEDFDMKVLLYPLGKNVLKQIVDNLELLDFGKYDEKRQCFIFK